MYRTEVNLIPLIKTENLRLELCRGQRLSSSVATRGELHRGGRSWATCGGSERGAHRGSTNTPARYPLPLVTGDGVGHHRCWGVRRNWEGIKGEPRRKGCTPTSLVSLHLVISQLYLCRWLFKFLLSSWKVPVPLLNSWKVASLKNHAHSHAIYLKN